jgi:hypothetical protein
MSNGKILTFAAILSFVGVSDVLGRECYRVKSQPEKPLHQLEIREKDDWKAPPKLLAGVSKFELLRMGTSGLLEVKTLTSIVGGAKATHGWIEQKFRGDPTTCWAAYR